MFSLQCALPSLLAECGLYVSKAGTSVFGAGKEDTGSESSKEGILFTSAPLIFQASEACVQALIHLFTQLYLLYVSVLGYITVLFYVTISFYNLKLSSFFSCFQAVAIMEVAHGKDHHYVAEVKKEIEEQKWRRCSWRSRKIKDRGTGMRNLSKSNNRITQYICMACILYLSVFETLSLPTLLSSDSFLFSYLPST